CANAGIAAAGIDYW
nr:immunoglobulin heavy chain junction region [Macaca mulatta]MOV35967.1 immunoglobulin heavy chain junction region [Macaca mulatta]MOV36026.1 immunoglobulin heavy chain junction region [Macaca mulatta]MOV36120.1 immunoglobulin heavy chain junction region [Macaca mulatta]MOV36148.1 immunoglobulin heavy chain junction region [Macaca mulatta]